MLQDHTSGLSTIQVGRDRNDRRMTSQILWPVPSRIAKSPSATIAIVGVQLAGSGLPTIRDATCMQVNALGDLPDVMMRLRCRKKISMRSKTP